VSDKRIKEMKIRNYCK